jgi:hypothetical protein
VARSAQAAAALPSPRREEEGRPREERRRSPAPLLHGRLKARLPVRVLVFVVCLALLAVGRVTLSFAVVQKNLQTDNVVREYRRLDMQNQQLAEKAAGLASSLKVRNLAVKRYHLVLPSNVQWVTAHPAKGGSTAARR